MPVPPTQPRVWTPLPGRRGQTLRELPKLGIGLHTDVQQILIRSPRRTVSDSVPSSSRVSQAGVVLPGGQ